MTTRLSDIVEPTTFFDYWLEISAELSDLIQSGAVTTDPVLAQGVMGGGVILNAPSWTDLDASAEENTSSDDPATLSSPGKIAAKNEKVQKLFRNNSWSTMNLAGAIAGDDPMRRIADRVANFWNRRDQRAMIAALTGVLADNVANNSSDMLVDIATDAVGAPTDAELIGPEAVINAAQTMGDAADDGIALIMLHSVPYSRLQKLNAITYRDTTLRGSDQPKQIPYYLGKRVVVDDMCPAASGTNRVTYTTYLMGPDAVARAEGRAEVPVEVDTTPRAGNGEGSQELYMRRQHILHPRGISFEGSPAGKSPTNTELEAAGSWTRRYERKNVRVAFLKTNG